jgi:hydroxymethylpyrimidine pyrophosphatase-like HAD family hydrolase
VKYFHAIAIDYDGTLAEGPRPDEETLAAVREIRESGRRVILVTGRILDELGHDFPDFAEHFDAIVGENGAVVRMGERTRRLGNPIPVSLDEALLRRGVPFRRGQVLLACDGEHDVTVLEELRRLGLDSQIVRNRAALMVLPSGITKGVGLFEALGQLGISRHSAIGVGDAENDEVLLETCELGVAVANAVPALKAVADVVLSARDGKAVAELLRGPLLRGELIVEPSRWHVELGRSAEGETVTLPASQINLLVTGPSGSGKSYLTGFLVEQWIALGYSVVVIDPEGDHCGLGRLRGVAVVGGREPLPPPSQLARVVQHRMGSVVVDLSLHEDGGDGYVAELFSVLDKMRSDTGLPHWLVVEEAHGPLASGGPACPHFDPEHKGYCLVTWQPLDLCRDALGNFDFLLAMAEESGPDPASAAAIAQIAGQDAAKLKIGPHQGIVVRLGASPEARVFEPSHRLVQHVRHWHKYAGARLPAYRRFYFRNHRDLTGAAAANLEEFHHELRACSPDVLRHHAAGGDFSRWVQDVIQDGELADSLRGLEHRLRSAADEAAVEGLRGELLAVIESRYGT